MNKPYNLQGARIIIRRLFRHDTKIITECFNDYGQLFFSPVSEDFINRIFPEGEVWGAFVNNRIIACSYLYPLDCKLSEETKRYSQLTDFIADPSEYLMAGYIGIHHRNFKECIPDEKAGAVCCNMYQAFLNTAEMQAFRRGKRFVVHCTPVKLSCCLPQIFNCGYKLVKMRGLEKLVVHYIFTKSVYTPVVHIQQKGESCRVAQSNTKALSRFLEDGYCAFDILKDGSENIFLLENQ